MPTNKKLCLPIYLSTDLQKSVC